MESKSLGFVSESYKNVLKAGACVTLLQKIPNKPKDNKIVTHYLLACFINISEETAEQILKVQNYEQLGIEESHVMKLLDVKSIQKKYTPEEINEFSSLNNENGALSGDTCDFNYYYGAQMTLDGLFEAVDRSSIQLVNWAQLLSVANSTILSTTSSILHI